jgi:hypothetical protein
MRRHDATWKRRDADTWIINVGMLNQAEPKATRCRGDCTATSPFVLSLSSIIVATCDRYAGQPTADSRGYTASNFIAIHKHRYIALLLEITMEESYLASSETNIRLCHDATSTAGFIYSRRRNGMVNRKGRRNSIEFGWKSLGKPRTISARMTGIRTT